MNQKRSMLLKKIAIGCLLFVLYHLFLFAVLIGVYLHFQNREFVRGNLENDITHAIEQNAAGEIPVVDMAAITPFTWDRMYIFYPYTPPERIDAVLGRFWLGARMTTIESNDRIVLLVFTRGGRVIQYVEVPRGPGDFNYLANEEGYALDEAKFLIDERGRMNLAAGSN